LRDTDNDEDERESTTTPWRVALRVARKESTTPPLAVPLPSGSLYYLLDSFNHNHDHAVLAGSNQFRYSSTHRVAREGRGTWQYIREKCRNVLASISAKESLDKHQIVKAARAQQQLLTEIEFEWLRQWYIQGKLHASLHPYWHKPILFLESCYLKLEQEVARIVRMLEQAVAKKPSEGKRQNSDIIGVNLFDALIETFEERNQMRIKWKERLADPSYDSMTSKTKPFQCSVLDRAEDDIASDSHLLPENLDAYIARIRKCRKAFVQTNQEGEGGKTRSDLTKKEKRRVASNWEALKSQLSKGKK
jgi:alpha-ketoglutarate-dependent dioxygenase FTO